ncbi:MAG: Ig-like domain-containing protein [bacterium]|nr:Ig-like domain-containing protein [bacterium]
MKKTSTIGLIIIFILLMSKLVLAQGMPANPSPADETAIYDARPTFSWNGVSNATGYFLELADNPSFDPLLKAVETSDTNYTISSTYLGGDGVRTTFYWRVRAVKNTLPSWDSGWAGPWEFYLYPPKLLTPLSESDTVSNVVTFLWENAGADTYTIQLDDASNFTSPDTTTVSTTNSCTIYIGKNGTYYWRVRASDGADTGVQSNWSHAAFASNVWTIRVRGPELISLPNDSITNNLRPSFAWEKVTDNSADTYSFQISTHNTFTSPWHSSDTTTSPYNLPVDLAEGTWFWRVKCNVGCVSNWSKVSTFIIEPISTEGPNPPTLFTPADGAYKDTSTPFFSWNGQSDISYYQIQIDQDESFSIPDSDDTLIDATPTNTFYQPTVTLPDRTYWWRVRAVNTSHRLGNWSIHRKVIIDTAAPAAVTLISPSNNSYTNDPTPFFDWNDPEPQLTYTIQADNTDSTISSPELNKSGLTASQLESTHNWGGTGDTTAWWRVIAVDNAGNTTASTVWKVFIDINAPSASTLKSPVSGSYSIDPSPTFEWYAATDTDDMSNTGNQTYTLQMAEIATGFTTPVEVITGITGTTYSLSLLDGSYLWRIKAYDAAGNGSGWSAEWLLVIDTVAPSQPVLVSPTNGSTTNDTTPIFDWEDVTDENLSYYSIVADTDGINLTTGWIIYDTLTGSPPLSYFQYSGTGFGEGTTYYWQVKAFDRAGNVGPSAIWQTKFDTTAPTDPVLVSPSHGTVTNDNTPAFNWDDVNGGESVISCRLQIAENNAFAPVVLEANDLAASTYTLYAYQALPDGVYYWRAMATDAAGNESEGNNKFSLTIDTTAPDSPTLTNPPPGTNVVVGSNPTFTWQAVTGADSYDLQIDDDPDFSSPVRSISGISPTIPTTSYTPSPVLSEGTYYWRVRARDAAGNIGNWRQSNESPGSVTVDTTAPDAPYLTSPADGAYLKESMPWFSWPAVTDSVTAGALTFDTIYYTIQFSKVSDFANTYSVYTNYPYAGNSTWYHPEYFSDPMFNSYNISFPDGTYYWRISATDYAGNESSFSNGRAFVVDTTVPSAPTLVAPANGAVVNPDTSTLIFNWSDEAGATYTLQVDDNNDFSSPEINKTLTLSSYTVTEALSNKSYYWRVKATDQAGNAGNWSTGTRIVIIDTQTGGDFSFPKAITPTHLSSISDSTPTFEWTAVTEGISPPITYTLQIDDNGSFSSPEIFTTTSTSYTHMTVMSEGIYYWRVQGEDAAHNNTNWSETVQFKVDTTTPSGPALILPANSGTSNAYPTFRWSDAADTSGVTYTLRIDLGDSTLTTPEIEVSNYSDTSYTVSSALVVGKTYYWRVRAQDGAGNPTEWSATWSVTISPTYLNRINGQISSLAIAESDTWTLANSPYVSEDDLIINDSATLTIEPGVVIKFKTGENISLLVKGLLNASGTSSHRITFTSNADTPQACDWRGIVFADQSNDSSVLNYCDILYAGSQNGLKQDAVEIRSASPTISNSRIAKSCGYGIYAQGNSHPRISSCTITENESSGILFEVPSGTLNVDTCTITWNKDWGIENLGDPWLGNTTNFNINGCTISANTSGGINTNASPSETIANNRIKNNRGWAIVKGKHSLADSIGSYVIKDNDISGNKHNGIHLTESKHSKDTTWYRNWNNADNIPVPIYFEWVSIDPGVSLSIKPGVVAKIGQDLTVKGTIIAQGTDTANNSVIFTSYQDDTAGGDTNYDGATTGQMGDWQFVYLDDASGTFDYCIFRYSKYGLKLNASSPTIQRSVFKDNAYRAIGCENGSSPVITGNTMQNNGGFDPHSLEGGIITTFGSDAAKPTITNNRIVNNNNNYPILITADNAGRLSGNIMTGNTYNAIRIQEVVANAGIAANVTWSDTGAPFLITEGLIVKDTAEWKIDPGVIIKVVGSINVNGWITAMGSSSSMITFTSRLDDEAGGDTNNDGSTTSPAKGNWGEITLNQSSDSSAFEYVLIRYASVGLNCVSSSPAIKQSQFTNCLTAINCNLGASPTITGVTMASNNLGLLTGASSRPTLSGSDIYGNNFGVLNTDNSIIINARNNWWGNLAGPKDSSLVGPGYNPAGLGNEVSDYVDYSSWRTVSQLPAANAGPDQTVSVGSLVMLDGTGSSDPEGDALTYIWTSAAGNPAPVTLTNVARPTFTPTTVGAYLFSLVVRDGGNNSLSDQVTVTVAAPSTNIPLRFDQASYTVTPGAQIEVKVEVGSAAFPANDMFGLFIKVNFLDSSYLSVVDVEAGDFLIGAGKNASSLVGPTWQVDNGNLEVGISRKGTNYTKGANGQGTVAKITFELSSTLTQGTTIDLTFSDVVAKDSNNSSYGLTTSASQIITGSGLVQYLTVWPGDTNNDGYVDARDVLPIGLYWNNTGSARSDASISWIGQRVLSWTPTAAIYADANGDGTVNASDVLVLGLNWHKRHNGSSSAPEKSFEFGAPAARPARSCGSSSFEVDQGTEGIDHSSHLAAYRAMYQALEGASSNQEAIREIREFLGSLIQQGLAATIPSATTLLQNYPNPINPETWIPFALEREAEVRIRIYDLSGRLVRELPLGELVAGSYMSKDRAAYWDGRNISGEEAASGVYLYQLQAGNRILTKRMIVMK